MSQTNTQLEQSPATEISQSYDRPFVKPRTRRCIGAAGLAVAGFSLILDAIFSGGGTPSHVATAEPVAIVRQATPGEHGVSPADLQAGDEAASSRAELAFYTAEKIAAAVGGGHEHQETLPLMQSIVDTSGVAGPNLATGDTMVISPPTSGETSA